jgi:hypothetical protein
VHGIEQDAPHPVTDGCAPRFTGEQDIVALLPKVVSQQAYLGGLSRAFGPLEGDE